MGGQLRAGWDQMFLVAVTPALTHGAPNWMMQKAL